MKKLLFIVLLFASTRIIAQEMLGIRPSNYAGLHGLGINPSNIIDSRLKTDINILSGGFTLENDYLFIPKKKLRLVGITNIVDKVEAKEYLDDFFSGETDKKNLNTAFSLMGPSILFQLNKKHSLAIASQLRGALSTNDVLPEAARYSYAELEDPSLFSTDPKQFRARNFLFNVMAWQEFNFSYGSVFHNKNGHVFKAAATVKYLAGISGAYVKDADIYFNVADDSSMIFGPTKFEYGRVSYNTFDGKGNAEKRLFNGSGFGWDLGFIYEWRNKPESYMYEMDGEQREDPEKNKYKLRIGASLLDMGRIKYKKNSRVFNINSQNDLHVYPDFNTDEFDNQLDFDSSVSAIFYGFGAVNPSGTFVNPQFFDDSTRSVSFRNTETSFIMNLPSAWSVQVDWNIYKRFYLNANIIQGFKHNNNPGVERAGIISIAPRYESQWVDVSIPVSFVDFHDDATRLGLGIRLGSLFFGTDKLGTLLGISDLYGMDFYAGLKFSLFNLRPHDRDNDRVSDRKDKCIDIPGVWKFEGCPDRDGDGIQDINDACPDVPGILKFNGCPDRDNDDIPDAKDDCPDDAGLPQFNGCPDTDGDGIMNKNDSCVTDPGLPEFNGCPDRDGDKIIDKIDECPDKRGEAIYNGCPDSDGDEIPDPKDKCPFEIGPISNEGCPVRIEKAIIQNVQPIKVELSQEEAMVMEMVVKNLQFETGKAIIKPVSFESLNQLADLLKRKTDYKLTIDGHTDNVGSAKMNLDLSSRRAKAAKDFLISKGVAGDRIKATGYGLTKPIAPNTTDEGRQQNRRVEFAIVK
jgi:outer membrane protein OmpA-like peptidoglycan-associated protein